MPSEYLADYYSDIEPDALARRRGRCARLAPLRRHGAQGYSGIVLASARAQ
ncbi:MAG: hypothetical protein H0U06_07260 [Solirubrobacterales bacterium]|nr:hypothetical protein [Solirubrobacterales bacterium]